MVNQSAIEVLQLKSFFRATVLSVLSVLFWAVAQGAHAQMEVLEEEVGQGEYGDEFEELYGSVIADDASDDFTFQDLSVERYGFFFFTSQPQGVRQSIQRGFESQGFYEGTIDGLWGRVTLAALKYAIGDLSAIVETDVIQLRVHAAFADAVQRGDVSNLGHAYEVFDLSDREFEVLDITKGRMATALPSEMQFSVHNGIRYDALTANELTSLAHKILDGSSLSGKEAFLYSRVTMVQNGDLDKTVLNESETVLFSEVQRLQESNTRASSEDGFPLERNAEVPTEADPPTPAPASPLSENEISNLKRKCDGSFSIKGICWRQTHEEIQAVMLADGYECSSEYFYICEKRDGDGGLMRHLFGELIFTCGVTNTCSLDLREVAEGLIQSGKMQELTFDYGSHILYNGPVEQYCGRAKSGERVCVRETAIFVQKGSEGGPQFD